MMRITATTEGTRARIALAGRLAGPWVEELRESWRRERARREPGAIQIDLGDVVFVDAAGARLLRSLHEQGAWLVAENLLIRALLDEIASGERSGAMHEKIEIGYQAFVSDGGEEFGAVREVLPDSLVVYVENAGDFRVPASAVKAVHSHKVVFDCAKLDAGLRRAIGHAHDAEVPGL